MFKYGRMQKGIPSCMVSVQLLYMWRVPRLHNYGLGSSHCWARIFSAFKHRRYILSMVQVSVVPVLDILFCKV